MVRLSGCHIRSAVLNFDPDSPPAAVLPKLSLQIAHRTAGAATAAEEERQCTRVNSMCRGVVQSFK